MQILQIGDRVIYNPTGYDISTAANRPRDHGIVIKLDECYVHMKRKVDNYVLKILYRSVSHYPPKENLEKRIHIVI
jgi:hypothetical protein